MDKVYRLLGRPISVKSQGCRFTYDDTSSRCRCIPTPAWRSEVVSRWLASPKHRASLLSQTLPAARRRARRRCGRGRPAATSTWCRISRTERRQPCQPPATWVGGGRTGGGRWRGTGHAPRPVRPDRAGVEVGGAVGDGARPAGEHQRGELLAPLAGQRDSSSRRSCRRRHRRTGSRGRCRRPGVVTPQTVLGKVAVVDAVQHHLGDRDLAVERLATRFEVDRLRRGTAGLRSPAAGGMASSVAQSSRSVRPGRSAFAAEQLGLVSGQDRALRPTTVTASRPRAGEPRAHRLGQLGDAGAGSGVERATARAPSRAAASPRRRP